MDEYGPTVPADYSIAVAEIVRDTRVASIVLLAFANAVGARLKAFLYLSPRIRLHDAVIWYLPLNPPSRHVWTCGTVIGGWGHFSHGIAQGPTALQPLVANVAS